jgi:hypothetical protein
VLRPHNLARHALSARSVGRFKADALADDLQSLKSPPTVHKGDLARDLRDPAMLDLIIPRGTSCVVNSTAALSIREALDSIAPSSRARFFEAALFSKARIGYLLAAGKGHNPSHSDLIAELYATLDDKRIRDLMFDPVDGLTEVQIGQGCGSLTMRASDAQLSMMTAAISLELGRALDHPVDEGQVMIGMYDDQTGTTTWSRRAVQPFITVPIEGDEGWTLRISPRVAARIRAEASAHRDVETGGVLTGLASART